MPTAVVNQGILSVISSALPPGGTVLDINAPRTAALVNALRLKGISATAYNEHFPRANVHDRTALSRTYDFVVADRWFNLQRNLRDVRRCVETLHKALKPGKTALVTYPLIPRSGKIEVARLRIELEAKFSFSYVGGTAAAPVWLVRRK